MFAILPIITRHGAHIPDWAGFVILGCMLAMAAFSLWISWVRRNDPKPILKRTKNPYRRYRRVG